MVKVAEVYLHIKLVWVNDSLGRYCHLQKVYLRIEASWNSGVGDRAACNGDLRNVV
jgi:hypothetical protein